MARHANVEKALLKPIYVRFQSDVARVFNSGIDPQGHLLSARRWSSRCRRDPLSSERKFIISVPLPLDYLKS